VAPLTPAPAPRADESSGAWLREQLARIAEEAVAATEPIERRYAIAGSPVLLRFAGPAMLDRLAPAFAHLEAPFEGAPALTIDVWDSRSTGTEAPPRLGAPVEHVGPENGFAGAVYYYESDGVQALARWRTLAAFDSTTNAGWFWAPSPEEMLSWDWAYPIRPVLDWWLGRQGIVLSHGGAVGIPEGGIAIVGRGGSGKSTSTLSSIGTELKYAGDDLVAIRPSPSPWLYSLYSSGKMTPFHFERFPRLAEVVVNPVRGEAEKGVAYIGEQFPEATVTEFPLRAIVVPRVTDRVETRLVETSPAHALAALAPSTILQAPPHRPEALQALARLVRSLPSYSLELGSNLELIPQVILDFLRRP
jgi:hypothetical protein